ncbi:Uu.00g069300.m01.CDS01 [Anthostomella pinea]|uniref:Uu.00g069300.m01.CDS01 n=1 Tax=Anthostomella pinea TaxID=933095 RepID=A0AAI8VV46_9PEZI|nr:Uu.00g069300.m01.CDS01 [Anthostomella pinea]
MSDHRRVTFSNSTAPRESSRPRRSLRESARDSGLGSSSSEQARVGGNPDRSFTAQDYAEQFSSPAALREAYGVAREKAEHYKIKYQEKDDELVSAHKSLKEVKAAWHAQCDHVSELEEENQRLRDSLKQLLHSQAQPAGEMSGAATLESSARIGRTSSRRDKDGKDMAGRMKERLIRDQPPEDSRSPKSSHHRSEKSGHASSSKSSSRRLSVASTSRKPYIEPMPSSPTSSRHPGNYTTASGSLGMPQMSRFETAKYSPVPRMSAYPPSSTSASYLSTGDTPGDYVAVPLSSSGKRRS